jgi:hypothetical protein
MHIPAIPSSQTIRLSIETIQHRAGRTASSLSLSAITAKTNDHGSKSPSPPVSHQNVVNFSFSFMIQDLGITIHSDFLSSLSSFLWLGYERCDGSSVQDLGIRRPLDRTVTSSLALLVRPVLPRLELGNTYKKRAERNFSQIILVFENHVLSPNINGRCAYP